MLSSLVWLSLFLVVVDFVFVVVIVNDVVVVDVVVVVVDDVFQVFVVLEL